LQLDFHDNLHLHIFYVKHPALELQSDPFPHRPTTFTVLTSVCLQQADAGDVNMLLDKYANMGIFPDFSLLL
jgi:hypothetical protein